MNAIEVTREDCEALGIIGADQEITPDLDFDMNESLEAHVDRFGEALQSALVDHDMEILNGVLRLTGNARRADVEAGLAQLAHDLALNAGFDPGEPRLHGKWVGPDGIGGVFDRAVSGRILGKRALSYQHVSDLHAQRVMKVAGIDVRGFRHAASPDDIRHVHLTHGSALSETPRGLLPLTREDFVRLPRLMRRSSKVSVAGQRRGVTTLRTVIHANPHTYVVLEDVHRGRHELALHTMVKMKYRPAINARSALSSTSETCRANNGNLLNSRRAIKSILGTLQEGEAE
jgi:hypothetical protein